MARSARELARETPALSSLPMVYARLTEALAKPRVSTAQIAKIIACDSALTARGSTPVNAVVVGSVSVECTDTAPLPGPAKAMPPAGLGSTPAWATLISPGELGSPATLGAPQLARADDGAAPPEGQFPTAQALTLLVVRRGRSSRRIPAALSSPAVGFL